MFHASDLLETAVEFSPEPSLGPVTTYRTVLALDALPGRPLPVRRLALLWSTRRTSGVVREGDLIDLSLFAEDPAPSALLDRVMLQGQTQPIGGAPRRRGGIRFSFDLDAAPDSRFALGQVETDLNLVQFRARGHSCALVACGLMMRLQTFEDGRAQDRAVLVAPVARVCTQRRQLPGR